MKRILLSIVTCLTTIFPGFINAQVTLVHNGWVAACCKCANRLLVDPLPAEGFCRHCHLLCPNCRKEIGDLDKASEDLKQKNRALSARYRARQEAITNANEKMTDALVKTYGQESGNWSISDPSTWQNLTMSGFNSSFGKFTVAAGNVVTSFGGGLAPGMLFNALSTLQSSNFVEFQGTIFQSIISILTDDGVVKVYTTDINKACRDLLNAFKRGQPMEAAMKVFNQEVKRKIPVKTLNTAANGISTFANLYSLVTASSDLLSNITDIYDNYRAREASEEERKKLQDEIVKNSDLLRCIKETQDSIKNGGLGFKKNRDLNQFYASKMLISFLLPKIINNDRDYLMLNRSFDENNFWEIDTIRIKSAIAELKKLDVLLNTMINNFFEKIIPPLVPWVLNQQQELKSPVQLKLLQMAKKHVTSFKTDWERCKNLCQSINTNLAGAVTGYELAYLSGINSLEISSPEDYIKNKKNEVNNTTGSIDKWTASPNEKIKGEFGRVNMEFPANVEWRLEFFAEGDNYIGSRTRDDRQNFYDIAPGTYRITLNNAPFGNISTEKGKEIKLKVGFLNIVSRGHWELFNESKEKFYLADSKPQKLALPPGNYMFTFEDKHFAITIKDKASVKFELPLDKSLQ